MSVNYNVEHYAMTSKEILLNLIYKNDLVKNYISQKTVPYTQFVSEIMQFSVNVLVKLVKIKADLKSLRVPQRVYSQIKIHKLHKRKLLKFSYKNKLTKSFFLENLNHFL